MAIRKIHLCLLDNPLFEGFEFSEVYPSSVYPKDAIKFISNLGDGFILPSARELGALKIENKNNHCMEYDSEMTRTAAIYFKSGNDFFCAFDDIAVPEKNIIMACAPYLDYAEKSNNYLWSVSNPLVKDALLRAEKSGRIVKVLDTPAFYTILSTCAVEGKSEFGQHNWNKALFLDMSELYAEMLDSQGRNKEDIWSLNPGQLEQYCVNKEGYHISSVQIGYFVLSQSYSIQAWNSLDHRCFAQGVRSRSFDVPLEKGRIVSLERRVYSQIRKMCG